MLQQTQVRTALPYYERFVARFPTLEALAGAAEEEVLALWSGLGYYARARNLHAAAREALARHGGLPGSLEALRALPGFGPYTAGAVASLAFAIPAPAVDGNVARVLARLVLAEGDPAGAAARGLVAAAAAGLVDPRRPGDLNQALIELGATVCVKPAPRCARCPLAGACAARAAGREREIPPARRRPARKAARLACALVEDGERILVVRRPPGGLFAGLWALPSAEVDGATDAGRALALALRRDPGLSLRVGGEAGATRRALTHRDLELVAYRCRLGAPPPDRPDVRWIGRRAAGSVGMATAMRALLAAVA
jgi:A/G-specific adenine glycosylase